MYPLHRRLGGLQGRSEKVRKTSPPPEFDPRTDQHVASRYTDWANMAYDVGTSRLNASLNSKEFSSNVGVGDSATADMKDVTTTSSPLFPCI